MKRIAQLQFIFTLWTLFQTCDVLAYGGLVPINLRCEHLENPLGIDIRNPRLSWQLKALDPNQRGQKQLAYQILVASDPNKLHLNEGDLWDTGRKVSDQTLHVQYNGKVLPSKIRCFWKVRVWDENNRASSWSEPALWSMGLLDRQEWDAKWIGDPTVTVSPEAESRSAKILNYGYHCKPVTSAETEKWIVLDIGSEQLVEFIKLFPALTFDDSPKANSFYFPRRFKVEVSTRSDFKEARTVVDHTVEDISEPHAEAQQYKVGPIAARYLRLTVTGLRMTHQGYAIFALSEIEVWSGSKNLSKDAKVEVLDSDEGSGWSKDFLVDGNTKTVLPPTLMQAATYLRKPFEVAGEVKRATVYVKARGVYELRLNGKRVGDRLLSPEWTSYQHRIQYQTYDVTRELRAGKNTIGAILGAGWYSGRIGLVPKRRVYGPFPQLLLRLEVELKDGKTQSFVSDESWQKAPVVPLLSSDILDGEIYDARKETGGWDAADSNITGWQTVEADSNLGKAKLVGQINEPIRVVSELAPVNLTEPKPGSYIFDLGQNMVGWCRIQLKGAAGENVRLRYAEMLNDDGTIYTANLRGAPATDHFVLRGSGEEVFEPHFTYHGFRYVEVTGLSYRPPLDAIRGRVFHSSAPDTGAFETSSPLVNQLMHNIVWTQRANLHSIPTDCPQRDERLGWMGDIQAFSQTAIFNMNMAAFFSKWLQDVRDDQLADGRFPDFAPNPFIAMGQENMFGAPAWADAGTIVPWRAYLNYADIRLLEQHFESSKRWADFVRSKNPGNLWENSRGGDYNDWLNADTLVLEGWPKKGGAIPKPVFATAFYAHSVDLVARMAATLGRVDEAKHYEQLFGQIKAAFNRAYVSPDGRIEGNTQAGYALALHFDLLPESLRAKATMNMVEGLKPYNGQLSTGIQSTHRLMLELTRNGLNEEAYRLLNLRSFPSWGFMIDNGATTIWERWDGYVKGRGFQDPGMNSFNHWAFGAVGEWLWRNIIGINPDESKPGYQHFIIRPRPGGGLIWAKGAYDSIRGLIVSDWKIDNHLFKLKVSIPVNTTATVYVPTSNEKSVKESGNPVHTAKGVTWLGREEGTAKYRVLSGSYEFTATY